MFYCTSQGVVFLEGHEEQTAEDNGTLLLKIFAEGNTDYPNLGTELNRSLSIGDWIDIPGQPRWWVDGPCGFSLVPVPIYGEPALGYHP